MGRVLSEGSVHRISVKTAMDRAKQSAQIVRVKELFNLRLLNNYGDWHPLFDKFNDEGQSP